MKNIFSLFIVMVCMEQIEFAKASDYDYGSKEYYGKEVWRKDCEKNPLGILQCCHDKKNDCQNEAKNEERKKECEEIFEWCKRDNEQTSTYEYYKYNKYKYGSKEYYGQEVWRKECEKNPLGIFQCCHDKKRDCQNEAKSEEEKKECEEIFEWCKKDKIEFTTTDTKEKKDESMKKTPNTIRSLNSF